MMKAQSFSQKADNNWAPFPGGELEGRRPKALCPTCRERSAASPSEALRANALCFQCYRAGLDRDRALKDAAELNTASEARFQHLLPLEPINKPRLDRLRMERAAARARARFGTGQFVDKRRHAQIAARHALQQIAIGLKARTAHMEVDASAMHAAELQLPEAWLPFVASR
jgi:hypothetical protein